MRRPARSSVRGLERERLGGALAREGVRVASRRTSGGQRGPASPSARSACAARARTHQERSPRRSTSAGTLRASPSSARARAACARTDCDGSESAVTSIADDVGRPRRPSARQARMRCSSSPRVRSSTSGRSPRGSRVRPRPSASQGRTAPKPGSRNAVEERPGGPPSREALHHALRLHVAVSERVEQRPRALLGIAGGESLNGRCANVGVGVGHQRRDHPLRAPEVETRPQEGSSTARHRVA